VGTRRGFTLLETLIAMALLVGIGLVILALFKSGFESTAHGKMRIEVQQKARGVLERISRELGQAALLPSIPGLTRSGQAENSEAPSPVLIPAPTVSGARRWQGTSTNQVIFSVGKLGTGSSSVNTARLADYTLVEYQVKGVVRPDGTAPGPVVRRTYQAFSSTSPAAYNGGIDAMNWLLTPASLTNLIPLGNGSTEEIVASVPFPQTDGVRFTVSHNSDARNNFHSSLFELTVQVAQYPNGQSSRERKEAVEQTTVSALGSGT